MMGIEKTTDMAWIDPKDVDRYWHLQPTEANSNHGGTDTSSLTVRRKRIRRAQYTVVGALHWNV